jgi:2-dehydro-3-deoxyphosphogluconate aldolase/(4S)-4-hydroxy-2-oxoglutarate aldolase
VIETRNKIVARVRECGVVAVLRADSVDLLTGIGKALVAGGVTVIEVTTSTRNAIDGIGMLAREFGDRIMLGVGTVLDTDTARHAIAAGARFVVSPVFDPAILATAHADGCACMPGCFTPTEILRAHHAGADVAKVFPSTALGPGYFKDILAPLPFLKLMPTGGVDVTNAGAWIKAGAICVGAGSALVPKEACRKGDWQTITNLARQFVEAVRAARS